MGRVRGSNALTAGAEIGATFVTLSNTLFLVVFIVLGTMLMMSIASYRFTAYRVAVRRGRAAKPVWKPFWLS